MLAGLVFFFAFSISAFAQEVEIPAQWQDVLDEAPISSQEFQQTSLSDWLEILFGSILENAVRPFQLMAKLCALMIAAALARAFCGQESTEGAQIIDMVTALSAFVLCAASLSGLFEVLQGAMKTVQSYLASFIPVFASVLTACGQVGSAAIYTGLFFGGVNLIVAVVCAAGFPITQVSMALSAMACMCSLLDFSRMAQLVLKASKWLLALCGTAFTALMTLQSVFAQSADNLALKAGKFLLGSTVPVVGRAVSDALGSVIAGMQVMKGSIGFVLIAVIAAAFFPIILQCLLYKIVFMACEIGAGALGTEKSRKLMTCFSECTGLYASIACFFCFVVVASTILMVLLGSGG